MTEAPASSTGQPEIVSPADVFETAADSMGAFVEPISKVDRHTGARDFPDLSKSFKRAAVVERRTRLEGAKVVEAGSGFGTNLAVWLKHRHVDAYGVEPGGRGFNPGYLASRRLLAANSLDPERVIYSTGETLPFPDVRMVASKLGKAIGIFRKLNAGNWIGRLRVLLQGRYPIYLTVRKGRAKAATR